jgi:Zn-dependent protease
MLPRTNFQLARIFGIRIGVGASWFVVLFLFIFSVTPYFHEVLGGSSTTAYLVAVAAVMSSFVSIILHELGHALVARRNGIGVAGIDLWALGGVARMTHEPQTPGVEFRVAAAGPLVTIAIVLVGVSVGVIADSSHFFEAAVGDEGVRVSPAHLWLSWLVTINVIVLILNLVPAYPLDGGRIAHAAVWWRTGSRNQATRVAGRMGQLFGGLMGVAGATLLLGGYTTGLWLGFIAIFVYQGATAAVAQSMLTERIAAVKVADIMDREPVTIPAGLGLLDAQEQYFLRYRWPWFAVVDPARHFLGVVRSERVDAEISAGRPALEVADVLEANMPVRIDEEAPLESLLRSEGLARLGAMVAVDHDGVIRGVVTLAQIRQALRPAQA